MAAIQLSVTDTGEGPLVVVLHGLFGRKRNWQGIQKRLSDSARIITADLRNHGDSDWDNEMSYEAMAEDIGALIESYSQGPAIVVGHSMGGKAAMTLALTHPELVRALMVIDIAPVAYDHDYSDYIDAMRSVPLRQLSRRSEAMSYLEPAVEDPGIRAFLMQNLGQNDSGLWWQVNLDAVEDHMPDILGFPAMDDAVYAAPTSFVRGGLSDYVREQDLPLISILFPAVQHHIVDSAGHWVHAEKPADVIALMSEFISANS